MSNLRDISRALGRHYNYVSHLKSRHPEKFAYIESLDNDLYLAFTKYDAEIEDVKGAMTHIYYTLVSLRKLAKFSEAVQKAGIYKHRVGFANGVTGPIFNGSREKDFSFDTLQRFKKVLKLWEDWHIDNLGG